MEWSAIYWFGLSLPLHGTVSCSSKQPFTHEFPNTDMYELISPDLLHQVIKGCFKDHLVMWVRTYFELKYGKAKAKSFLNLMDQR